MDLKKTMADLDTLLAAPKTTAMTKEQFEAYAAGQLEKAKDEEENGKKEDAMKRLAHLRKTIASLVSKAEGQYPAEAWSGDNGTELIPEYAFGYEDTTRKTEISEMEGNIQSDAGKGTQADGASFFSNMGDLNGKNPQTASGTETPAEGQGTQGGETVFSNPGDLNSKNPMTPLGKAMADLQKTVAGRSAHAAQPSTQQKFAWPGDLAEQEYLKDGITKRAPDHWGGDSETAK